MQYYFRTSLRIIANGAERTIWRLYPDTSKACPAPPPLPWEGYQGPGPSGQMAEPVGQAQGQSQPQWTKARRKEDPAGLRICGGPQGWSQPLPQQQTELSSLLGSGAWGSVIPRKAFTAPSGSASLETKFGRQQGVARRHSGPLRWLCP